MSQTKERILLAALSLFACDGYEAVSVRQIASALGMSTETARTHIRHIYQKTGIHSREELMDAIER